MLNVRYLVIDVDGTMTDGGIYYDDKGNELKKFCTKDAVGFFAANKVGIKIIVLTGRECVATTRRMTELKVDCLYQNVKDKAFFLHEFMKKRQIKKDELGYLGDDLNDLAPMQMAGFRGCPVDSCMEIKEIAHYISPLKGGYGAVRDVIEYMLKMRGEWEKAICEIYGVGI